VSRIADRVAHGVPQPDVDLLRQFLELVADLDLGLAADLLTDTRPGRAKA
jgi:hypothetical protein